MRIHVIGAASVAPGFPLSTFLIDDHLAIDAGALGWFAPVEVQARIKHILLTHSHLDHIAGLPILLDNVYTFPSEPPIVYGIPETLEALEKHLFNDVLMPDFVELSRKITPFLKLHPLTAGAPVHLESYSVLPILVKHTVPTVGYYVDDGQSSVLILTDTAPLPDLYHQLKQLPRLKAVFLEASFPNALVDLARISGHLTAGQFLTWAEHFGEVPVYAIHVKPRFVDEIRGEIAAVGLKNVKVAESGLVVEV